MKTITSLFFLVFMSLVLPAQDLLNLNPKNSCSYFGEEITDPIYGFASSNDAQRTVGDIVELVGLRPNFEIKAGNVPNAVATVQDGKRLIIYSQDFMLKVRNNTGNDWAATSILAHEIGHHLNGHTIGEGGSRPSLELESDQFSGFILGKMGATLQQAQKAISIHGTDRGSSTHPPRSARLEAIAVGWNKATEGQQPTPTSRSDPNGQERYPPAVNKGEISQPARPEPRKTTTINIGYGGDLYGCGLPITITIAGVSFMPVGNHFQVADIPSGQQSYTVSGQINCLSVGSCTVQGTGTIDVQPNQTYWVMWQNSAYGQCTVWLSTEN